MKLKVKCYLFCQLVHLPVLLLLIIAYLRFPQHNFSDLGAEKAVKDSTADKKPALRKAKSGAEPIIVHIVLKMAEFDHGV